MKESINQLMQDYINMYSRPSFQKVEQIYNTPCIFIQNDLVLSFNFVEEIMAHTKELKLTRSGNYDFHIRQNIKLGEKIRLVKVVFILKNKGKIVKKQRSSCTLIKEREQWKIIAVNSAT